MNTMIFNGITDMFRHTSDTKPMNHLITLSLRLDRTYFNLGSAVPREREREEVDELSWGSPWI